MKRFINLKKALDNICKNSITWFHNDETMVSLSNVINILYNTEDADVQPVVHGHWERMEDECCFWFECSNCRNYPPKDVFKKEWLSPFCPVCGAKMNLERREE